MESAPAALAGVLDQAEIAALLGAQLIEILCQERVSGLHASDLRAGV